MFKCLRLNSCRVLKTGKKFLFDCTLPNVAQLQELVLLKEFNTCPLGNFTIYLNERKMEWSSKAAVRADKFLLTQLVEVHSVHHEHTVTGVSVGRSPKV